MHLMQALQPVNACWAPGFPKHDRYEPHRRTAGPILCARSMEMNGSWMAYILYMRARIPLSVSLCGEQASLNTKYTPHPPSLPPSPIFPSSANTLTPTHTHTTHTHT